MYIQFIPVYTLNIKYYSFASDIGTIFYKLIVYTFSLIIH
jgi:hypothetical protein